MAALSALLMTVLVGVGVLAAVVILAGLHYLVWGRALSRQASKEREEEDRQALLADLNASEMTPVRSAGAGDEAIQPPGHIQP